MTHTTSLTHALTIKGKWVQGDRGGNVSKVAMKLMGVGSGGPYGQERTGEAICLNPGFERKEFNQPTKGSSSCKNI